MFKFYLTIVCSVITFSCLSQKIIKTPGVPKYVPESKALHDTIARMDSIFFEAYNSCKMDVVESLISDSMEFYHDQGGLSTSKKEIVEAIKKNICGKVRREVLKGSIEVYNIPNFGAVEMGAHRFHNLVEKSTSRFAKFVLTWHRENGHWKLYRIISLH
jgi:hypothetical protein